jgi:secondary thiamine-phosphate synthase enzyme
MEYTIRTSKENEIVDITSYLQKEVSDLNINDGIIFVFVPHTTAGVTINENADHDVVLDFLYTLHKLIPKDKSYKHLEGNSDAHLKASLIGSSCSIIIENGRLKLGTWQGVYFCDFDGPRTRRFYTKIIKG